MCQSALLLLGVLPIIPDLSSTVFWGFFYFHVIRIPLSGIYHDNSQPIIVSYSFEYNMVRHGISY